MLGITLMTIALLDELLFWMRLRREAREAAERLIEVFERHDDENASHISLYSIVL